MMVYYDVNVHGDYDLLMYGCKYLIMQMMSYWWDRLYNDVNYIIMGCELCIVERLLEVHAFIEYCNHEDGNHDDGWIAQ
jgi:hypothetical protein